MALSKCTLHLFKAFLTRIAKSNMLSRVSQVCSFTFLANSDEIATGPKPHKCANVEFMMFGKSEDYPKSREAPSTQTWYPNGCSGVHAFDHRVQLRVAKTA